VALVASVSRQSADETESKEIEQTVPIVMGWLGSTIHVDPLRLRQNEVVEGPASAASNAGPRTE
jgi:hypothetical protein